MDHGRTRATCTALALSLLALDVAASHAIAASDPRAPSEMRKLIGKRCDQLESVLGRPRVFTTRAGQGRRGEPTTIEVRTYDDVTALCANGRVISVEAPRPDARPPAAARAPRVPPAPLSSLISIKPRFSPDRRTLVLLDEVRDPGAQRQPEIALKMDPTTSAREVTVSARGMSRLAKIRLGCEKGPHDLTLSAFSQTRDRNTATFVVPGEVATAVLAASSCYLSVAGAVIPLPRDLLPPVWGSRPRQRLVETPMPGSSPGALGLPAYGQVRYVNEHGVSHWVSSIEQVPERYRDQVLEQRMANKPFFEPTIRSQNVGLAAPIKWELVRRDFEDSGQRLKRHVLRAQLSAKECLGLMRSTADNDPAAGAHRSVTMKSGYGIGLFRRGAGDVPVKVWQCVEQE